MSATPEENTSTGPRPEAEVARRVIQQLPAMVAYWDRALRCRYANDAYLAWFGKTAAQMDGLAMEALLGPLFLLNKPYVDGALAGKPQEFERLITLPTGEVRESLATYTPDIAGGAVRGFVAHVTDVTGVKARLTRLREADERARSEQAERMHLARVKSLVAKLRVGVLVQGPKAEIEMSNPAALELLGLTEAQLLGTSSFDPAWNVIHEDGSSFPGDAHPVPRAIATRMPVRGVVMGVYRPALQDRVWLLVDAEPHLRPDGEVEEVICTFVDVTELREAQVALATAQSQLQQAVQAGKVGLWEWDIPADCLRYSAEWSRTLGYGERDVVDTAEQWRDRVHPDDVERAVRDVQDYLRGTQSTYQSAFRLRHRDGSYRYTLARGSMVRGSDGRAVRMVGANVDITERTELQLQLLQSQKLESVGRLAGGIAHDFNNILTIINTTSEMALRQPDVTPALRADLTEIQQAGGRAAALTQQLLAFSRKQMLTPTVLELDRTLADMQEMLRRLISKDISLDIGLGAAQGHVRIDHSQLEQIVVNLVVNAAEAMPHGGELTLATDFAIGPHASGTGLVPCVRLRVSDTGAGMDEAMRQRIFEPFFTTKQNTSGTGLGLATVYGIVQGAGGAITVESMPREGSTFTILLPAVTAPAEPVASGGAEPAAVTETVLVVEDEEAVRRLLTRILTGAGYVVLSAPSGEDALALLSEFGGVVDLLITDVVMPGMNGRELAAQATAVRPDMRAIFVSGYTDDDILRDGVRDDAAHFIGKPYSRDQIVRKVRAVLDARIPADDR